VKIKKKARELPHGPKQQDRANCSAKDGRETAETNQPKEAVKSPSACPAWPRIKRSQLGGSVLRLERFWECELTFAGLRGVIGRTHAMLGLNRFSSVSFSFLLKKKKSRLCNTFVAWNSDTSEARMEGGLEILLCKLIDYSGQRNDVST
jgi:hypothetical protein